LAHHSHEAIFGHSPEGARKQTNSGTKSVIILHEYTVFGYLLDEFQESEIYLNNRVDFFGKSIQFSSNNFVLGGSSWVQLHLHIVVHENSRCNPRDEMVMQEVIQVNFRIQAPPWGGCTEKAGIQC